MIDDPENLIVSLTDHTLSVSYTVGDPTHRYPGGVLVFDTFVRHPPHGEAYVNTDTLRVTGPSSTAVTHAPEGSIVEGNQTVVSTIPDRGTYSPRLGRDATIAFAPNGGIVAQAATVIAVRAHALGMIESELLDADDSLLTVGNPDVVSDEVAAFRHDVAEQVVETQVFDDGLQYVTLRKSPCGFVGTTSLVEYVDEPPYVRVQLPPVDRRDGAA